MRLGAVALLLWACSDGGSDGPGADASAGDGSGPGTATLLLAGTCVARNTGNSDSEANIRVDCAIRVSKDGAPLTTAQVRINPAPPAIQTQLLPVETDPSLYTGFYSPYGFSARISAIAGDDSLDETVISGPQMFRIERPTAATPVAATEPMTVTWERPDTVAEVDVVLDSGYQALGLAPDPGTHNVPASELQAGSERVKVTRWRANPLGIGAAAGSIVDFGVESTTTFTIE
jgi:hypothetical protein